MESPQFVRKPNIMDDELLIRLVRERKVLYDLSDPKYMDTTHKETVWNDIGNELDMDGISCKKRWCNIRDNFRKSLKKIYAKSSYAGKIKRYKYCSQLEFLKMSLREDDSMGEIIIKNESPLLAFDPLGNNNTPSTSTTYKLIPNKKKRTVDKKNNKLLSQTVKEPEPEVQQPIFIPPSKCEVELENDITETIVATSQSDSVDAFLCGIAPTLKSLPPYYLNLAKTKIFGTVQEYEMIWIMEQDKHATQSSQSTSDPFTIPPDNSLVDMHNLV